MKILNIDDMLEAAHECGLPNRARLTVQLEATASALAEALAEHLGINATEADWQGKAFAGLCASFSPAHEGQACPEVIDVGDEHGEWP